jgi:hypothetical protein
MVEHLPTKHKALIQTPVLPKKRKAVHYFFWIWTCPLQVLGGEPVSRLSIRSEAGHQ